MDPLTIMLMAGTAIAGIGKLYEGVAGGMSAENAAAQMAFNRELLDRRAELEREQVQIVEAQGTLDDRRTREQIDRVLGGQLAHFAAGNLDPVSGSPLLLASYTAGQGEVDLAVIRARVAAERAAAYGRAAGTTAEAAGAAGQEFALRTRADQMRIAGVLGAASTVLTLGSKKWAGLGPSTPSYYAPGGYGQLE